MPNVAPPKYLRTKRKLEKMIRDGRWPTGSAFPSETQLLGEFDVSRPTLVRSLRDLVREGYLHRRQGQGTVVADYRQALQRSVLPILITDKCNHRSGDDRHVLTRLLDGIQDATRERSWQMELIPTPEHAISDEVVKRLGKLQPQVALVYLPSTLDVTCKYLTSQGCRLWGFSEPSQTMDTVYIDEAEAARVATRHLIERGRKRIALLNGLVDGWWYWGHRARLDGYRRALEEAGLPFDPALVREDEHLIDSAAGRRMMRSIIASGAKFDAVFGVTDRKAMGAMAVLTESGRRIPQDVGIVSIDDTLAVRSDPPLSAVRLPFQEMAAIAAGHAMASLDHTSTSAIKSTTSVRLACTLTDRGSA